VAAAITCSARRQLKSLIHVAELGSLSKAADRLNIAQPALSRQIRLLEEELGVFLFERHGRGMVITEVGHEVLDHANSAYDFPRHTTVTSWIGCSVANSNLPCPMTRSPFDRCASFPS